ncbi:hypothetical protein GF338_00800 [candidate division WOR-3 bacterium]|nr:hypothetical protein [candidate division WOR-3 bacterium]
MHSEKLTECLIGFFFATTVSSAIVETLDENGSSLNLSEILSNVRDIRRLELPQKAVESSLTILEESGFVKAASGTYELTSIGEDLASRLAKLRNRV